jgi:hypothetical protein
MIATALLLLLGAGEGASPEERAVAYLAREVPRWRRENGCFSCHNNGDAARALFAARRRKLAVPPEALADTIAWLSRPVAWDDNQGDPGFSDKRLARVQFSSALADGLAAGLLRDRRVLGAAAEALLPHQAQDGSWPADTTSPLGSPATYGTLLATYTARRALEEAGAARFRQAISRANAWLARAKVASTMDAAVMLMALGERRAPECLPLVVRGQTGEGGWGPYPGTPAEPFDTALVLLAIRNRPALRAQAVRGRAWLVGAQLPSGGWQETTRPPGGQSYAQHVSTTGWAALALLETHGLK